MKTMKKLLWILLAVVMIGCGASRPEPVTMMGAAIDTNHRGIVQVIADETGVADGTFDVYVDMRKYKRADIVVEQDGGSGTISFTVEGSWDSNGGSGVSETTLTYIDIGLSFYSSATFTADPELLIDNGWKLYAMTWMRIQFTVAGASSDASYKVSTSRIHPGV
jgi:hypothetical protein